MIHGCLRVVLFMRRARNLHVRVGPPSTCADKIMAVLFAASPVGTLCLCLEGYRAHELPATRSRSDVVQAFALPFFSALVILL